MLQTLQIFIDYLSVSFCSGMEANKILLQIFKIQHRVFRHKNLQKHREEKITNDNIPENNRTEIFFGSYLSTPEIIDCIPFSQALR